MRRCNVWESFSQCWVNPWSHKLTHIEFRTSFTSLPFTIMAVCILSSSCIKYCVKEKWKNVTFLEPAFTPLVGTNFNCSCWRVNSLLHASAICSISGKLKLSGPWRISLPQPRLRIVYKSRPKGTMQNIITFNVRPKPTPFPWSVLG